MNATRLRAQIIKELLCVLRDPKSRFVLIIPPIVQLFVFAFAVTFEVNNIDIALMNRDGGGASVALVQAVTGAKLVRRVHVVANEREAAHLIDEQRVIAAMLIPEDFSRQVHSGKGGVAQVILDGRKANAAQITLGYLQEIAARTGTEIVSPAARPPDPLRVRHAFNPNLTYPWFVVPGLIGILLTFVALLLTALSIARERELGTFDQLLVSPCSTTEIIIAKAAPAFVIPPVIATLMTCAGVPVFGIPLAGSLPLLFLCLMIFLVSLSGVGLMISSVASTQQQAILGVFAIVVPSVLLSGFAIPVQNMPVFLQWLSEAIPLKHFLVILHGTFLKAMPPHEILRNAWPMVVIAVITLGLARRFVRSKLQ